MKKTKNLWTLDLHEDLKVNELTTATRVVGGWIYESYEQEKGTTAAMVFVPYNSKSYTEETIETDKKESSYVSARHRKE